MVRLREVRYFFLYSFMCGNKGSVENLVVFSESF